MTNTDWLCYSLLLLTQDTLHNVFIHHSTRSVYVWPVTTPQLVVSNVNTLGLNGLCKRSELITCILSGLLEVVTHRDTTVSYAGFLNFTPRLYNSKMKAHNLVFNLSTVYKITL